MRAYRVELLVVDHDGIGADGIVQELENARYGNRCISPQAMHIEGREIGAWEDSHPLNHRGRAKAEYMRLFFSDREGESKHG